MIVQVELDTICDECGARLDADFEVADYATVIRIKPCPTCQQAAEDAGYYAGYNAGYDDGYNAGYDDAEKNLTISKSSVYLY